MLAAILLCFALLSFGQEEGQGRRQQQGAPPQATPTPATIVTASTTGAITGQGGGQGAGQARGPQERPSPTAEEAPVVTHHEIRAGGKTLRYTATVGMMPLKNREGETEARIFFMASSVSAFRPSIAVE